jgi:predicted DNA-binding helix-hairpin-helix protein
MTISTERKKEKNMAEYKVNDDDWMLDHFGYTKDELVEMMHDGEDVTAYFDGDPIDLLG